MGAIWNAVMLIPTGHAVITTSGCDQSMYKIIIRDDQIPAAKIHNWCLFWLDRLKMNLANRDETYNLVKARRKNVADHIVCKRG